MDIQQATDLLWNEARQGRYFPADLRGKLTLNEALRVQLGTLHYKIGRGDKQVGWKVGLTSPRVRKRYGSEDRPFGHIMESGTHASGTAVHLDNVNGPAIEPELCFLVGRTLRGPGVTPDQARNAISAVGAAFEMLEDRANGVSDFPLTVADDLSQWGLVVGPPVQPLVQPEVIADTKVTLSLDGEVQVETTPAEALIDDHFLSISILANTLAEYDLALEEGMRVITGSFTKVNVAPGQRWEATFSGIGSVEVSFR